MGFFVIISGLIIDIKRFYLCNIIEIIILFIILFLNIYLLNSSTFNINFIKFINNISMIIVVSDLFFNKLMYYSRNVWRFTNSFNLSFDLLFILIGICIVLLANKIKVD